MYCIKDEGHITLVNSFIILDVPVTSIFRGYSFAHLVPRQDFELDTSCIALLNYDSSLIGLKPSSLPTDCQFK